MVTASPRDKDNKPKHGMLETFNAGDVVDHPGEPTDEPLGGPAGDSDAPPPG